MDEGTRLESVRRLTPTVGSNPTPSATFPQKNEGSVSTEHKLNNSDGHTELIPHIKPPSPRLSAR